MSLWPVSNSTVFRPTASARNTWTNTSYEVDSIYLIIHCLCYHPTSGDFLPKLQLTCPIARQHLSMRSTRPVHPALKAPWPTHAARKVSALPRPRRTEDTSGTSEQKDTKLNLTADKDDANAEKSEKATEKHNAKGKKAEKPSRSLSTRSSSSSGSQPPSTPPRMAGRTVPAPASIRHHIDQARAQPSAANGPLAPGPLDPKADQVHVNAYASNIRLVSEARQIIARSNARFPCITAALLQKCSASHLPKPNFADLPPTVVIEAARAVMNQEAVLAALLASAIAESATHGAQGKRAVEELSETFDLTGQDMIELNRVTCALNTCDITLGVYPIGQIALAIYFKQHSPTQAGGPDVEGRVPRRAH